MNLLYGLLIHTFSILGLRQTEKALNVNIASLLTELHFLTLNFFYMGGGGFNVNISIESYHLQEYICTKGILGIFIVKYILWKINLKK